MQNSAASRPKFLEIYQQIQQKREEK